MWWSEMSFYQMPHMRFHDLCFLLCDGWILHTKVRRFHSIWPVQWSRRQNHLPSVVIYNAPVVCRIGSWFCNAPLQQEVPESTVNKVRLKKKFFLCRGCFEFCNGMSTIVALLETGKSWLQQLPIAAKPDLFDPSSSRSQSYDFWIYSYYASDAWSGLERF
jgi:hypothetical protein